MVLKQINGFYTSFNGSYTMLSWKLIKEVSMTVYQNLNKQTQFNIFGSHSYAVDKIYAQTVQGRANYAKNSPIVQAWWHLTLCSLYIEGVDYYCLLMLTVHTSGCIVCY